MLIDFGIDIEQFRKDYREKNPYLRRAAVDSELISLSTLNEIIYLTEPKAPFIRLHNGDQIPEDRYVENYVEVGMPRRRIVKKRFYDLMREGATMILNRIESKSTAIKQLCLDVSSIACQQTLANGYLAFGRKTSFGNHWDSHDVFAVQLFGRKRWKVYHPTFELPLQSQTSKEHKADCPTEPVLDIILEAGDLLYIPRGWWHSATPIGEETFHVAIGVHPAYISDYVSWLCSSILQKHVECRQSILQDADNSELLRQAANAVKSAILDPANFDAFKAEILKSERVNSPFDLGSQINSAPLGLTAETWIRANTNYIGVLNSSTINGKDHDLTLEDRNLLKILVRNGPRNCRDVETILSMSLDQVFDSVRHLIELDLIHLSQEEHRVKV